MHTCACTLLQIISYFQNVNFSNSVVFQGSLCPPMYSCWQFDRALSDKGRRSSHFIDGPRVFWYVEVFLEVHKPRIWSSRWLKTEKKKHWLGSRRCKIFSARQLICCRSFCWWSVQHTSFTQSLRLLLHYFPKPLQLVSLRLVVDRFGVWIMKLVCSLLLLGEWEGPGNTRSSRTEKLEQTARWTITITNSGSEKRLPLERS
jgi:hypothetical protein